MEPSREKRRSSARAVYVVKPIDFAHLDRTTAVALSSRGTKAGGHPDVDRPLYYAPRCELRAKRLDSGSAGLA